MDCEKTDTIVVGGGQAGIAMSEHLSKAGVSHLVLERDRIAERWRTCRWDSLVANGPAWHDRFPGMTFDTISPDDFATKDQVAEYLERYAKSFGGPIRTGVEVTGVSRLAGKPGFAVATSAGDLQASRIVVATGPFQRPVIPAIAPDRDGLQQLHSTDYKNPSQLTDGAVLVVGAGSSGAQIADELCKSGRKVFLSVGPHDRPPRKYRGRDFCWWLGLLGGWDKPAIEKGSEHVTIAVSGADGGRTVDFRQMAGEGIVLLGSTTSFRGDDVEFSPDLVENIEIGDSNYFALLDAADAFVEQQGLDLPKDPEARNLPPDPECMLRPIRELNLIEAGITSIIWATGFTVDYAWLDLDVLDERGSPIHHRGISAEPGAYFLGLPWLSRRGSSFIWGVWHDAKYIADHIVTQRSYLAYRGPADISYGG